MQSAEKAGFAALILLLVATSSAADDRHSTGPEAYDGYAIAEPLPFVGRWSMSLALGESGQPDVYYVTCENPITIEKVDDSHIFYLRPGQADVDAAIQLSDAEGLTFWDPIAGGPRYFTRWIAEDMFYLYDERPQTKADWKRPFVYRRCAQP